MQGTQSRQAAFWGQASWGHVVEMFETLSDLCRTASTQNAAATKLALR